MASGCVSGVTAAAVTGGAESEVIVRAGSQHEENGFQKVHSTVSYASAECLQPNRTRRSVCICMWRRHVSESPGNALGTHARNSVLGDMMRSMNVAGDEKENIGR